MKRELISDAAQGYVSRLYEEDEYPVGQEEIITDVEQAFKDGSGVFNRTFSTTQNERQWK